MDYQTPLERQFIPAMSLRNLLAAELVHAGEIGHDVVDLRRRFAAIDPTIDEGPELAAIYGDTPLEPPQGWYPFERSGLDEILAHLPAEDDARCPPVDDLAGRLRGAWHGRVIGNMLGKPVEFGWPRAALRHYLDRLDAYPLRDYVPIRDEDLDDLAGAGFFGNELMPYRPLSRGRIQGGVRDDDVDWTILNLALLEDHGCDFTPYDLARTWTNRLPIYQTFTAERVAYQNLVREVPLHATGLYRNPYRELIGALIRADPFGYVFAGRPRFAARLAHRDAFLSHRANGIYGAMWAAALIASAFMAETPLRSVRESLRHVPAASRLAVEVATVVADFEAGTSWDQALDGLDRRYPALDGGHVLNNAGALTAAILWGDGDFSATIAHAVQAGLDSDSIGATAGSWAGAFVGFDAIPDHWLAPLQGHTRSAVFGFAAVDIDALAARTLRLAERFHGHAGTRAHHHS